VVLILRRVAVDPAAGVGRICGDRGSFFWLTRVPGLACSCRLCGVRGWIHVIVGTFLAVIGIGVFAYVIAI
jgi:hypothetical protein